jgi:YD repeat-containing protein
MKFSHLVLATFVGVLSFTSCKKDNSSNNSSSGQPKTYTEDITSTYLGNSVTTYNLSYDGNGRIVSFISASDPGFKFLYQYNSNNTFTMDLYNSNVVTIHEISFIGPNSYVDSTFQYNNTNDTMTEKIIYNSDKQVIQQREYDYSSVYGSTLTNTTNYTYDNNGNAITQTDNNGTTTTDYYTDLLNTITLGSIYLPTPKNLPKTVTYTSGGTTESGTHTYTFDSNNRLSTDKTVLTTGDIVLKTYTY